MTEIMHRTVFETCLADQTEAPWEEEVRLILAHDAALRLALATANRERDEYAQSRVAVWEEKYAALLAERDAAVARLNEANEREEKLHETNERLALDIVGAEEDRDDLAEILAAALDEIEVLNEVYHEDNAVCLCGCPLSEHENNGEDGEQCDHEGHVCLRTCPAIRDLYQTALAQKGAPDV